MFMVSSNASPLPAHKAGFFLCDRQQINHAKGDIQPPKRLRGKKNAYVNPSGEINDYIKKADHLRAAWVGVNKFSLISASRHIFKSV